MTNVHVDINTLKYILFEKNHSDSTKKFSETDIIKILQFLIDNIFVVWWAWFSTDRKHSYEYEYWLGSPSRRLVSLFVRDILHTGAFEEIRKKEWVSYCCLTPIQQFFSYIMARTSRFSMRWWWGPLCTRPTRGVRFL
jgi:RsiW-degrading membrane proteinase PrsW (M82 family)